MTTCPLSPLLNCSAGEGGPPKIEVVVTPSAEVTQLRERVKTLEADLMELTAKYKRIEFKYACECNLRMQICDWVRERGLSVPKRFFSTLFEGD